MTTDKRDKERQSLLWGIDWTKIEPDRRKGTWQNPWLLSGILCLLLVLIGMEVQAFNDYQERILEQKKLIEESHLRHTKSLIDLDYSYREMVSRYDQEHQSDEPYIELGKLAERQEVAEEDIRAVMEAEE